MSDEPEEWKEPNPLGDLEVDAMKRVIREQKRMSHAEKADFISRHLVTRMNSIGEKTRCEQALDKFKSEGIPDSHLAHIYLSICAALDSIAHCERSIEWADPGFKFSSRENLKWITISPPEKKKP